MITEASRLASPSEQFLNVFKIVAILFDVDQTWAEIRKWISSSTFINDLMNYDVSKIHLD